MDSLVPTERWALAEAFNPLSSKQSLEYLRHKRYPIPKDRKSKQPTTGEEALEGLLRKFPHDKLLPLISEARHVSKAIGYLRDNTLGSDGRIHPRYGFVRTGRLSAKNPNIMNIPQGRRGEILKRVADAIRATIIPDPGYVLAEFDWKAIEAVLTGWFAEDEGYIRMSLLDSHGWYASYLVGDPISPEMPEDEMMRRFSEIKKMGPLSGLEMYGPLRHLAKKINLATGYGMGWRHLASLMRCSAEKAKFFLECKRKMAPKVAAWQDATKRRAHQEGKLVNPFGYPLAFFEVFRFEGGEIVGEGKEANEALAFLPQSTAAAMLRETLLQLGSHPEEGTTFHLLAPIHDSIVLQILESEVPRIMLLVKSLMERKWPELGGLTIEAEAKTGRVLSKMEAYYFN